MNFWVIKNNLYDKKNKKQLKKQISYKNKIIKLIKADMKNVLLGPRQGYHHEKKQKKTKKLNFQIRQNIKGLN